MRIQELLKYRYWLIGAALLSAISLAYLPGLAGPFMFDDMPNIVNNPAFHVDEWDRTALTQAAVSVKAGPLYRPVAMTTFALNHAWSGLDPFSYKLVNLGIHLLATLIVAFLMMQLLAGLALRGYVWLDQARILRLSWLTAALWGLHPFNLTSVLYVVQRMTSLSGLFMLLALALYCFGRNRMVQGRQGWPPLVAASLCFLLAIFSKENSLVWPLLVVLLECCVYRFAGVRQWDRRIVLGGCVAVVISAIAVLVWLVIKPQFLLAGFQYRDFTLEQRLLTQLRVLWQYLYWILVPDITGYGLYHDDFRVSSGWLNPISTLLAMMAWCLVVPACLLWRRLHWLGVGLVFFLLCHLIESSAVALEMVHEHRNYVASLGILAPLAASLVWLAERSRLGLMSIAVLVVILSSATALRAWHWGSYPRLIWHHVTHHPDSSRTNYEAGVWYFSAIEQDEKEVEREAYWLRAEHYFSRATDLDDRDVAGIIGLLRLRDIRGERHQSNQVEIDRLGAMLVERLALYPVGYAKASPLVSWLDCYAAGACVISEALLSDVVHGVLNNARTPRRVKGRVGHLYGVHLYHQQNPKALDYIIGAIGHDREEGEYWLSLIVTLIKMGAINEARLAYQDAAEVLVEQPRFAVRLEKYSRILEINTDEER